MEGALKEGNGSFLALPERLECDRYVDADGNVVFTERFLLRQAHCCGSGCRHCPYEPRHKGGGTRCRAEVAAAAAVDP